MGKFNQKLNVANFICRFGEKDVLLDMAEDIVIPAFLGSFERTYADTKYFFIDTKLIDLKNSDEPELAIIGRYVKAGKIARDQVYSDGKIIKDHKELESAPTSFFVLLLSNHKLLYVRENSGAPGLQSFSSTVDSFIKAQRRKFIQTEFETQPASLKKKLTKKELHEKYPLPEINTVELSSDASIQEFVKKFITLNTVEVKLLDTNHELDNSPLFGQARKVKDKLGADSVTVRNEKKGVIGLNKEAVAALISKPAEEGNSRIVLKGIGQDGDSLNGNNEHFKLSVPISLPTLASKAANSAIITYRRTIESGMLTIQAASLTAKRKLKALRESLGYE